MRRRELQAAHNEEHGIVPETVFKTREQILRTTSVADSRAGGAPRAVRERLRGLEGELEREELARVVEAEMKAAAERLDFQTAALLRDQLFELRGRCRGPRPGHPAGADRPLTCPAGGRQ